MKILHCVHSCNPEGGGVWQAILQFSKELHRQGHETCTATTDPQDAPWCKDAGVPIAPLGPARNSYGYAPAYKPWLKSHAREYDCAIAHGLWQYPGRALRQVLTSMGVPYFVYPHGMLDPWFKETYPLKHLKKAIYWKLNESRLLREARSVLFTCEEERRLAQDTFRPYKCTETIAPLGIEQPEGMPEQQETAFLEQYPKLEPNGFLLFLSRVHEKKGLDLLLDALLRLDRPPPPVVVAGPVDSNSHFEKLRKMEANISARHNGWKIIWAGMLTGDLKWGALRTAGALILPSHQENFGIAVVEALAAGTPVLLSKKVNIWREIVEDKAGFADSDTIEGTRQILHRWLSLDGPSRKAMGQRATQCFTRRFEIKAAANHLANLLAT